MHDVEVSVVYWPAGKGRAGPSLIATTADHETLRLVRDRLIEDARRRAKLAGEVDPGCGQPNEGEAEHVERTLKLLIPDVDGSDA